MQPPLLFPLQVITIGQAALRWNLDVSELVDLERRLAGRERRMTDGRIGYYVGDIEAALCLRKAA